MIEKNKITLKIVTLKTIFINVQQIFIKYIIQKFV